MITVDEILEQVKTLNVHERKELAKRLIDLLDSPTVPERRLSELRGLGKAAWTGIDAQTYVDQLRDEWDNRL